MSDPQRQTGSSDPGDLRERAERLLAGIPEGEWEYDGTGIIFAGRAHVAYVSNHQSGERGRQAMRFIAAAPQLVRDLLAEIDRLRGQQAREVCLCAAIKLVDGRIVRCHRHCDGLAIVVAWKDAGQAVWVAEQGFMTSRNRFVGRREGRQLQDAAGIESACGAYRGDILFSDDLY